MFAPPPLRRTYEAAVRDLQSTRADVRASAARDLGLVGDAHPREAADALAPLIDDGDANVRSAALTSLGQLAARHLLDRIHPRFDDTDSRVRQMAVVAVAETGGERALTLLREGLKHTQADVRYQCLLGVLSINAREGFAVALDALTHDDPWIAAEAAEQIGRLIALDPTERTEVELDPSDRERALAALGAAMESPSDRVRVAAAMALARGGDFRALGELLAFVRGTLTVEGEDREALIDETVTLLGTAVGDDRALAREALGPIARRVLPTPRRALARAALARLEKTT